MLLIFLSSCFATTKLWSVALSTEPTESVDGSPGRLQNMGNFQRPVSVPCQLPKVGVNSHVEQRI